MKISLPLLPTGICRDDTEHDVEYYTMDHMHEYAEQAIREFVEGQEAKAYLTASGRLIRHTYDARHDELAPPAAYNPMPLIIKPELDDA